MSERCGRVISAVLVAGLLMAGRATAGSLDPTNAPGPTMHTLEQIYQKVQDLAPQTLQTFSATSTVVDAGYYSATNLAQVDTDLTSTNIRASVTLFGIVGDSNVVNTSSGDATTNDILINKKAWVAGNLVTGTRYPAPVPKTGQTTSYQTGDDGDCRKGLAWPNPRFTIGTGVDGTKCVTDNLTGLMWARNASLFGYVNWDAALTNCKNLNYGGYTDWRLPNRRELQSLLDSGRAYPALCNTLGTGQCTENDPFTGVEAVYCWTSTTPSDNTGLAWVFSLGGGEEGAGDKTGTAYVWPVRGGQ